MITRVTNKEIGAYLRSRIGQKYKSERQFCVAYLKLRDGTAENEDVQKMANKLSQILNGAKGIQIDDLPFFSFLLDVSADEIISAGKTIVPSSNRITNSGIACSKDKDLWEVYINREDKLILNTDEYGKTVLDYALDYENYDFLKYLMDNKYIWFVDDSTADHSWGFGAGTKIERRRPELMDQLTYIMREKDELRRKLVTLAIRHKDLEALQELRAREIPDMYRCDYVSLHTTDFDKSYDEALLSAAAEGGKEVIGYFTEEMGFKSPWKEDYFLVYPYLGKLIEKMLKNGNTNVQLAIDRALDHNQKVLERLKSLILQAADSLYREAYPQSKEQRIHDALGELSFRENGDLVCFRFLSIPENFLLSTNIVRVTGSPGESGWEDDIKKINSLYQRICNIEQEL